MTRDYILSEIRRLAAGRGGGTPGQLAFARETGISDHLWLGKFWARWSDAVAEAGLSPNTRTQRLDSDAVLAEVAAACRHYGRVPTKAEMLLYAKASPSLPSPNAIARHFGGRSDLIAALAALAGRDPAYADLSALLPSGPPQRASRPFRPPVAEGTVYLIKSGEFYKIGRSDELERRVREIRVSLPERAALTHAIRTDDPPGDRGVLAPQVRRSAGEWRMV